jgi:hypothetical protein
MPGALQKNERFVDYSEITTIFFCEKHGDEPAKTGNRETKQ